MSEYRLIKKDIVLQAWQETMQFFQTEQLQDTTDTIDMLLDCKMAYLENATQINAYLDELHGFVATIQSEWSAGKCDLCDQERFNCKCIHSCSCVRLSTYIQQGHGYIQKYAGHVQILWQLMDVIDSLLRSSNQPDAARQV